MLPFLVVLASVLGTTFATYGDQNPIPKDAVSLAQYANPAAQPQPDNAASLPDILFVVPVIDKPSERVEVNGFASGYSSPPSFQTKVNPDIAQQLPYATAPNVNPVAPPATAPEQPQSYGHANGPASQQTGYSQSQPPPPSAGYANQPSQPQPPPGYSSQASQPQPPSGYPRQSSQPQAQPGGYTVQGSQPERQSVGYNNQGSQPQPQARPPAGYANQAPQSERKPPGYANQGPRPQSQPAGYAQPPPPPAGYSAPIARPPPPPPAGYTPTVAQPPPPPPAGYAPPQSQSSEYPAPQAPPSFAGYPSSPPASSYGSSRVEPPPSSPPAYGRDPAMGGGQSHRGYSAPSPPSGPQPSSGYGAPQDRTHDAAGARQQAARGMFHAQQPAYRPEMERITAPGYDQRNAMMMMRMMSHYNGMKQQQQQQQQQQHQRDRTPMLMPINDKYYAMQSEDPDMTQQGYRGQADPVTKNRKTVIKVALKPLLAAGRGGSQYPEVSYTVLRAKPAESAAAMSSYTQTSRQRHESTTGSDSGPYDSPDAISPYTHQEPSGGHDSRRYETPDQMPGGYGDVRVSGAEFGGYGQHQKRPAPPTLYDVCESGFDLEGFCDGKHPGLYSHPNPKCFLQCDHTGQPTTSLCAPGTLWQTAEYEPSTTNRCVHSVLSGRSY